MFDLTYYLFGGGKKMKKKIMIMCILAMFLIPNMLNISAESKNIRKTREFADNELFDFHHHNNYDDITNDLTPIPYKVFDEFGNKRKTNEADSDVDSTISINNDPTDHKLVLTPPWNGYNTLTHEDKWGVSDCWAESTDINGNYGSTMIHAWAGPGAGWASIDINLMHYGVFIPPKNEIYSFKYKFKQQGEINLFSMFDVLGSSAARGGVTFYFYLWDGETIFFEKSMTVEDQYAIGGVGNGDFPYSIVKDYSNSANLKKGVSYIFGGNGIPWVVCDGFVVAHGSADQIVDYAALESVEIQWPNSPPNTPKVVSPADGATDVSVSPTLQWSCDDPDGKYDSLKYDVYFGDTSSPPLKASNQVSTSYNPGTLKGETTYYWKIVAKDSKGETKSSNVWRFTTKKDGCCFPAGTKITMADGTIKNIENIRIGDKILAYDPSKGRFYTWRVKTIGRPLRPLMTINNGLVKSTIDHPFYVKKATGETGWAAYYVENAEKAITFSGKLFKMEIGDKLFTSDKKWIEISNIEFDPEPVQTYNLLSYSGTKTYFANNLLVYEEHPPGCLIQWFLKIVKTKIPTFCKV